MIYFAQVLSVDAADAAGWAGSDSSYCCDWLATSVLTWSLTPVKVARWTLTFLAFHTLNPLSNSSAPASSH